MDIEVNQVEAWIPWKEVEGWYEMLKEYLRTETILMELDYADRQKLIR